MEECIRRGQPPPESIQNSPELFPGLNLFYIGFMELHSCRAIGELTGPIDWLTMDRYCERNNITGEQYEDFHYYLKSMDGAFLEHYRTSKVSHGINASKPASKPAAKPVRTRRPK